MRATSMPETVSPPITDASGFRIFSRGEPGAAHAMAHRLLDEGRYEEGRFRLGTWLECNRGAGSEWVHLQWHQAVFEIATGEPEPALARFERHILPAVRRGEADTDGPSLLWRLVLAGDPKLEVDWSPVRDEALTRAGRTDDPFVALHHQLAFAGARDVEALDRWLDRQYDRTASIAWQTLLRLTWGLRSFASEDYLVAAALLEGATERLTTVGGSRAQNELFAHIAAEARRRGELQRIAALAA